MNSGFSWNSLVSAGIGALAGAALGATLNFWYNSKLERQRKRDAVQLFRKKAELDAYQPVRDALRELHESVTKLAGLYLLLRDFLIGYGKAEDAIRKLRPPLDREQTEYVAALRERQAELDWRRAKKEIDVYLDRTREALNRFLQRYGSHEILFQGLWPGVRDLHGEVDRFIDAARAMQEHIFLGVTQSHPSPDPGRHPDLTATLGEIHMSFWEVGLYVHDMSREFQNLALADVAGRRVPYRTCTSPDEKLMTVAGLKTAAEVGAPIEKQAGERANTDGPPRQDGEAG